MTDIQYRVFPANPQAHLFEVELTIQTPEPQGQVLSLPAWIPGSYMIRDFAKNIVEIQANDGQGAVELVRLDKQTWRLEPAEGPVTLVYRVYAWDLSVRSAHLDQTHGYFNGASLFLRVHRQEQTVHEMALVEPKSEVMGRWRVATGMPAQQVDKWGFGTYRADNYDALIDYPVEMADFQALDFAVAGVPHRMVVTGKVRFDQERLARDLTRICAQHIRMFHGDQAPPVSDYLFQTYAVGNGYGGLEHRNSTSLMCSKDELPQTRHAEVTDGYRRFMGLCSHEYFHLWNVKRIQPAAVAESDLAAEAYTEQLWAFEGITSYYDDLGLCRAGVIEATSYLELLAQNITRVMRGSGRKKQSLAESSFYAWSKFYQQDENAPNAIVSYYAKGTLLALGLDMEIRRLSGDRKTLDDLMRLLWLRHGKTTRPVPERGVERLAEELVGRSLQEFFDRYLYGTEDLPLAEWFRYMGIGFALRPAANAKDQGGAVRKTTEETPPRSIGARWKQSGDFVELVTLSDQGAAMAAGLSAGDRIIAIDGIQASADKLDELIASVPADTKVPVHAFRRDELMVFDLTPRAAASDTCDLWLLAQEELDPATLRRRQVWLNDKGNGA